MFKLAALFVATLNLAATAGGAQSNFAPSLHRALSPCPLYSGSLTANAAVHFDARGLCNIPEEAVSIEVAITVTASSGGSLKLWEYDGLEPAASVMSYGGGTISSFGAPRLCAPISECFYDLSAKSSTAATLSLVAVGFYVPAEPAE